jgi:excisionase family DNA binding protein
VDRVLTVREVAELLQLHPVTVYRLLKTTDFPGFKVGSNWRFSSEAVEKWIKKGSGLDKS